MENNTQTISDRKGQTITFYSYKGGVGRSMALVNIACLAAKENKKILLIDCDLEAPGLHQFFKASEETPGFVDLISDVNDWISVEENNNDEGYSRFMATQADKYIAKNVNPIAPAPATVNLTSLANMSNKANIAGINTGFDKTVSVDLIKAGKFGPEYSKKLSSISWLDIYKKAPAFFRTFAYCLEKEYDYIFVDARTGLADTSGICTMLMPQKLVLVFALNNQNINGVVDVAGQAIDYRFSSNDYRELQVYPLPSRIENSVNPYLQQWIDNYKGKFEKLFTEKYALDQCRLSPYFDRCFIQYYAIHAYGENIPVLTESAGSSNFITYNYNNFLTILKKNLPAWEVISPEEELANERQANEHFKKGLDLYYKNEFEKAIVEYVSAIDLKPDFADAYFNRALCKNALKNFNEAIVDYNKVTQLEGNAADAYYSRGISKVNIGLHDDAMNDYNKAIDLKPDFADAYIGRGNVKNALYQFDSAIQDMNKAIELKPDYAIAYYNRGVNWYSLKNYDSALQDYNRVLELDPKYDDAIIGKGDIKFSLKNYVEAIEFYEQVIKRSPANSYAYIGRGASLYYLNRFDESLADNLKALELNPQLDTPHINIAYVYKQRKDFDKANEYLDNAIKLNTKNAYCWAAKAAILSYQGNEEGFYENIDKALAMGLDILREIENEPETFNKYLQQPRFIELLKKYNADISKLVVA